MYICYHGATSMAYDLDEDIRAAARAGFPALELWGLKFARFFQDHSIPGLARMLERHALEPAAIDYARIDLASDEPLAEARRDVARYGEVALGIGCDTLVMVVEGQRQNLSPAQAREFVATLMVPLGDLSARYGLRLALEPLAREPVIHTPRDVLEVAERSAVDHLGLALDLFHFYAAGGLPGDIRDLPVSRLFVVHASDVAQGAIGRLEESDRVLPGTGVMPLRAYMEALREIRYAGPVSVEVRSPDYAELDPDTLASRAYASLAQYLAVAA